MAVAEIIGIGIGALISIAFYVFLGYWICKGIGWVWKEYTGCAIGCTVYVVISLIVGLLPLLGLRNVAVIKDFSVGYLTEDAYNHGEFDDSAITDKAEFTYGESYYAVIDFTVRTKKKNDGNESIKLSTSVSDTYALSMTIQDAPTGRVEISESNASEIVTYYTIPSKKRDERTVRVILKIVPRSSGEFSLNISIIGDGIIIKGISDKNVPIRVK